MNNAVLEAALIEQFELRADVVGQGAIEAHTREDNVPMRATFRRVDWVKEAFHRDACPIDGAPPQAADGSR